MQIEAQGSLRGKEVFHNVKPNLHLIFPVQKEIIDLASLMQSKFNSPCRITYIILRNVIVNDYL